MDRALVAQMIDPFDESLGQPKLSDGRLSYSSGLRFRNVGQIVLDGTGLTNYIVLFPGLANTLCWKRPDDLEYQTITSHPEHIDTSVNRAFVQSARVHSAAVRLSLMNSADENEGFWEAVRIPMKLSNFEISDAASYLARLIDTFTLPNMANHMTYQSGKLKDLHRYQFKVNSISPDHEYIQVVDTPAATSSLIDPTFDMVVIKIQGRVDSTTPSVVMYDNVSNYEVSYVESTPMSRLATPNYPLRNIEMILERTNYQKPAILFS